MTVILFVRAPFTKPVVSIQECVEMDKNEMRREEKRKKEKRRRCRQFISHQLTALLSLMSIITGCVDIQPLSTQSAFFGIC